MVARLRPTSLRLSLKPFRRQLHNSADGRPPPLAFAFDIDGVLLRGEHTIPAAHRALRMLDGDNPWNAKIPFILMTNGGGIQEKFRSLMLSHQLKYSIHEDQVLQSHTVLKSLSVDANPGESRADEHILVIGGVGDEVRGVAESYGFNNVHTPLDILAWNPSIWPFHRITEAEKESTRETDFSEVPISSIFIFHDPRNWALDIQIMTDVVRSYPHGLGGLYPTSSHTDTGDEARRKATEVFFCNPDLLWKANYAVPRFGQGAFKEAFQAVFKAATGSTYPYTQFGKPHKLTYDYGKKMLKAQHQHLYKTRAEKEPIVFMVGDNPESDIAGANSAGWNSFLVETGVYDPSAGLLPTHTPTEIVTDVEAAVRRGIEMAFKAEGRR